MRVGKLAFLAGGVLAVLFVVGMPGLGQGVTSPEGELADAECYGHHKQEGFRSFDLFPVVVEEVPKGQEFEFTMTVRNPWLHEVRDLYGYVDVANAPGIQLDGGKDPVETPYPGETIAQPAPPANPTTYNTRTYEIPVDVNASEMFVSLKGSPGSEIPLPRFRDQKADFDLTLTSPDGTIVLTGPDPTPLDSSLLQDTNPVSWEEEIRVNQRNLTNNEGTWILTVAYRGYDAQGTFDLFTGVYYNQTGIILMPGPTLLGPNEAHTFTFRLKVNDLDGLQRMRYGGIAVAYHEHTDKNIGDIGNYDKWRTMEFETGATLRISGEGPVISGGADLLGPVFKRWGQVLGIAGSFLILPSLVFGGTFGKGSVTWLNKAMGTPRRRVLFHNSMSFWLLGVAVLHTFLFLYEAFWNWSHGLVWGGLSLACMIGLGVTGATQRSFVARWGFNRWRFIHFAMGVLVVVFVLIHMVADGSHFAFAREWFGGSGTDAGGVNVDA